jgi:hypothetical protein
VRRNYLPVAGFACALILIASPMFAESNIVHDRYVDSSTRVDTTLCSFPVTQSGSSNINDMYVLDENGKVVRLVVTVNHAVITFSANGKSLTAKGSGGIEYTVNPDGSVTAQTFGIDLLLVIPGYGPVFLDAGRAEFLFQKGLHEIFLAGPELYDMPAFCAALS